jgi:hypothetical protein
MGMGERWPEWSQAGRSRGRDLSRPAHFPGATRASLPAKSCPAGGGLIRWCRPGMMRPVRRGAINRALHTSPARPVPVCRRNRARPVGMGWIAPPFTPYGLGQNRNDRAIRPSLCPNGHERLPFHHAPIGSDMNNAEVVHLQNGQALRQLTQIVRLYLRPQSVQQPTRNLVRLHLRRSIEQTHITHGPSGILVGEELERLTYDRLAIAWFLTHH